MSRICLFALVLVLLGGFVPNPSMGLEMDLRLRYRGEASGRFENITPPAAFCAVWPESCRVSNFNFVADLPITYDKTIVNQASEPRDRHYIQMPAERNVQVISETGRSYELTFRFRSLSQQLRLLQRHKVDGIGQGGCEFFTSIGNTTLVRFRWGIYTPPAPQPCHDYTNTNVGLRTDVQVTQFGVGFELIMPRPIGMPQGIYRGSVDYTIGPGGDFDFGNAVSNLNGTRLKVNFELDVQHDLYLQFPPGSDRAVLEPPGGWMAWLSGRSTPPRLFRDIPLRIWSTGPIKLYKRCQYELAGICGLRESSGHMVPVQVAVTLPAGMQHGGKPINRVAIPTHEAAALQVEPISTVWNQPGQLHFEVAGSDVPSMLAHPGSRYEGLVTVVFEAQL